LQVIIFLQRGNQLLYTRHPAAKHEASDLVGSSLPGQQREAGDGYQDNQGEGEE
jgi:hypothetical protein